MPGLTRSTVRPEVLPQLTGLVNSFRQEWREDHATKTAAIVERALAAPIKAIGRAAKNVLLGPVAKSGPFKGQRMVAVSGKAGWSPISRNEFLRIQSGATPGSAVRVSAKGGPIYLSRVYRQGGAVGWAKQNPLKATAAVGGTYLLGTSPAAREMVKGFIPKAPENPVSPEVEAKFAPSAPATNPLAKSDWSPTSLTVLPRR